MSLLSLIMIAIAGCATVVSRGPAAAIAESELPAAYTSPITNSELETLIQEENPSSKLNSPLRDPSEFRSGQAIVERFRAVDRDVRMLLNVKNVPQPSLLIGLNANANAFVVSVDACTKHSVTVNGGGGNGAAYPALVIENFGAKVQTLSETLNGSCLDVSERTKDLQTLERLLRGPIKYRGSACKVSRSKTSIAFKCGKQFPVRSSVFKWRMMAPNAIITTAQLAELRSWDDFDALMAHELGHYYLLHSLRWEDYGYHYDRLKNKKAFKPESAKDLKAFTELLDNMRVYKRGAGFSDYFKSVFSSFMLVRTLGEASFRFGGVGSAVNMTFDQNLCAKFSSFEIEKLPFKHFLDHPGREREMEEYLSSVRDCLRSVQHPNQNADYYFEASFDEDDRYVISYFDPAAKKRPVKNLWEAFQVADAAVSSGLARAKTKKDFRRLGVYTNEQEADAFAIKYLKASGRPVVHLQNTLLYWMERFKGSEYENREIDSCLRSFRRGWKTIGRPFVPQIEDVRKSHHTYCYRLYNQTEMDKQTIEPLLFSSPSVVVPYGEIKKEFQSSSPNSEF